MKKVFGSLTIMSRFVWQYCLFDLFSDVGYQWYYSVRR